MSKLILGDCLEAMKDIHDKSIDLVLTSSFYNLGNNHHMLYLLPKKRRN